MFRTNVSYHSPKPQIYKLSQLDIAKLSLSPKKQLPLDLNKEQNEDYSRILRTKGKISKVGKQSMDSDNLACLKPKQWLNDEVINFYAEMIRQRQEKSFENNNDQKVLDCFIHSTFFFSTLESRGYDKGKLGKWVKKVDIFNKDLVLIPINRGQSHWICSCINFKKKRIEIYDSMGGGQLYIFKMLRNYLQSEHINKKGRDFDFNEWIDFWSENTPQQNNGFDCGVFTCMFMNCLSKGLDVDNAVNGFGFNQDNMSYLRKKLIIEIGTCKFIQD